MGVYDQEFHKEAEHLQFHFQDVVDDHSHPQMQALKREIHGLVSDIQSNRHPRDAEQRIKTIEHELVQARAHGEEMMSYQDMDALNHSYRRLRENIRKLPNY